MVDFKGRHFTVEVILGAVRWYLMFPVSYCMFPVSYRDLELMLADRGVAVDHTTISRWIQAYAADWRSGFGRICVVQWILADGRDLYPGHARIRESFGGMMRKLSVALSR